MKIEQTSHDQERDILNKRVESLLIAHPQFAPFFEQMLDYFEQKKMGEAAVAEAFEFFRFCRKHPFLALLMTSLTHIPLAVNETPLG